MNYNPETGVAYGYIAANSLDPEVVDELMFGGGCSEHKNHSFEAYKAETLQERQRQLEAAREDGEDERVEELEDLGDDLTDEQCEDYYGDEEKVEGVKDGVHFASSWLGGALNFFILHSPHITESACRASPCVPGAGILDTLDGDVKCYDVPADWRAEE